MPISNEDIKLYASTAIPLDDVSTLGGAIDLTNEILNLQEDKIFTNIYSDSLGGSDKIIYGKAHIYNSNTMTDLISTHIFLRNGLNNPATTGVLGFQSSSIEDDNLNIVRVNGYNSVGEPVTEDITLNGTTKAYSSIQFLSDYPIVVEKRNITSGMPINAVGNIEITRATQVLGIIPVGSYSATGQIEIGLSDVLNDTEETTNRLTAPLTVVFSKPLTYATALETANSGTLFKLTNQAIWFKYDLRAGALPHIDLQIDLGLTGRSS